MSLPTDTPPLRSKSVIRTCLLAVVLGSGGCAAGDSLDSSRIRLESAGRMSEGPLGCLQLVLEEGLEVSVVSRKLDSARAFLACTIRRNGQVIDEPDFVLEMNGQAEYSACPGPTEAVASTYSASCPLTCGFSRFEPQAAPRVRLSFGRAP